jgi:phosphoglycerate kinase
MSHLLPLVDRMLVGGGMCFTLLAALGHEVGESLVEESMLKSVAAMLDSPEGGKILLPGDIVVADGFSADASARTVTAEEIPLGWMGLDIGPAATSDFAQVIASAGSVFWNGPMGVFEWDAFRNGTAGVAAAVAASNGFTVVGGGDSAAALRLLGLDSSVSHLSSGGGAGLEMLEGKELPGVAALRRWSRA